jgi:hypothetical protein
MAIVFVNAAVVINNTVNGQTSYTGSAYTPANAGNIIVVQIHGFSDSNADTPQVSSLMWGATDVLASVRTRSITTATRPWSSTAVFIAGTTSPTVLTLNLDIIQRAMAVTIMEFSGVDAGSPVVSVANIASGSNATTQSLAFTTTVADAVIAGGFAIQSTSGGFTPGGSAVEVSDGETGTTSFSDVSFTGMYLPTTTVGSYSLSTSWVNTNHSSGSAVELRPASGGGGPTFNPAWARASARMI